MDRVSAYLVAPFVSKRSRQSTMAAACSSPNVSANHARVEALGRIAAKVALVSRRRSSSSAWSGCASDAIEAPLGRVLDFQDGAGERVVQDELAAAGVAYVLPALVLTRRRCACVFICSRW